MLLERKKRHRAANHEGSWAVSYVDMLTLLLCFFIIFFNSKTITQDDESNVLKKVIKSMNQDNPMPASAAGEGAGEGPAQSADAAKAGAPAEVALMEQLKFAFDQSIPAKTVKSGKALIIAYEDVSFFNSGSTKLNPEGKKSIQKIIEVLKPHRDLIRITVQGHTDPTRVRGKHTQFSDNWELSVLRATAVLKLFLKSEFEQQTLSAEGFADTQARELAAEDLSKFRNITFRIEPKVNP